MQVNYEGRIFSSELVYLSNNSLLYQAIPISELQYVITAINDTDMFQHLDLSNVNFKEKRAAQIREDIVRVRHLFFRSGVYYHGVS